MSAASRVNSTLRRASGLPEVRTNRLFRYGTSRWLFLQVMLPLPARGEPVHHGAVGEGALGRGDVLGLAGPGLLRRRLQGSAVTEGQSPGQAADTVHGIEMRG